MKFFDWCYKDGAKIATDLDYIALPPSVQNTVRAAWRKDIMADGKPVYK